MQGLGFIVIVRAIIDREAPRLTDHLKDILISLSPLGRTKGLLLCSFKDRYINLFFHTKNLVHQVFYFSIRLTP